MLALDLVQTLAVAGVVLFVGYGIKRRVPLLSRYNIPAPVVGGLLVAAILSVAHQRGVTPVDFDTTLQTPLQNAFFASVGFGASLALLRVGGPLVLLFFVASTLAAIGQNVLGLGIATLLGQPPLLGVLAGSVTLTGGPATGLAFAPLFEAGGRAVGGDAGRGLGDGRHRLRRADRRADWHVAHRPAPPARRRASRRTPRSPSAATEHRRGAGRRAGEARAGRAKIASRTCCSRR